MGRTPGFIVPSTYSSEEELNKDLRRRDQAAGFTPFNPSEFVGDFLEHFGVRGMKWGHRKDHGNSAVDGGPGKHDDSDDFTRTAAIAVKARGGGTRSLSNKELRDLVDRMNLEKSFEKINTPEAKKKSPVKTGVEYMSGKVKKIGDMTIDTILKTAVQVNVDQYKGNLKIPTPVPAKNNPQLKLFDYS